MSEDVGDSHADRCGGVRPGRAILHAPFIQVATGVELAGVVTRSPERREILAADCPGMPVFGEPMEIRPIMGPEFVGP